MIATVRNPEFSAQLDAHINLILKTADRSLQFSSPNDYREALRDAMEKIIQLSSEPLKSQARALAEEVGYLKYQVKELSESLDTARLDIDRLNSGAISMELVKDTMWVTYTELDLRKSIDRGNAHVKQQEARERNSDVKAENTTTITK